MSATNLPWPEPGYRPPRRYGQLRDQVQAGTMFDIEGEGPALVLVHGVGLDLTQWDAMVPLLREDFTLVRYDLWGHGGSSKPLSALRLKDYVAQLADLAQYLRLGRFALVGFSMGALIAQAYAARSPERLAGLCLMSAVHRRSEEARAAVEARLAQAEKEGPRSIIEPALNRWLTAEFRAAHPEVVQLFKERLEKNDTKGFLTAYRVFAAADRELADSAEKITCPALVMTGALDSGSTPEMAKSLAAELPDSELEILEGLAHLAPVEGADQVSARLRRFLRGPCAGRGR
jgi:pimeloyl-ACP methyl ester carboxylesterase